MEEAEWRNEDGKPIKVITWAFLEDSPNGPPPLKHATVL